ncbi:hypothetical protein [Grimontia sp. SpTr1]|uniref:hypothetical protein n=1 Tax=Grimontia sp. SpTr1 TaxID=2995319 RepID=UPI00248D265B|nr:hypothetical protein [Grimontia sp. SpTr1]
MRDNFSKDLKKLIKAIAECDFVLEINYQFQINKSQVVQEVKETPGFYGQENINRIDKFLSIIYGEDASILNAKALVKEEHCCEILKYMDGEGYITIQCVIDWSYTSDESYKVMHSFKKFFLSEKGVELQLKIRSEDNSRKSVLHSRIAIGVSLLAFLVTGFNSYLNNQRLEKQQVSMCASNPSLEFCRQLHTEEKN